MAVGDGHHDFASHDLAFHVGVGIVFAHIVPILRNRGVGSNLFQPDFIVMMQARFIVVDEYKRRIKISLLLVHFQ